jgi:hypothetical protein
MSPTPRFPTAQIQTGIRFSGKIASDQIAYVTAVVESTDGLAVLRTVDERQGLIEFWTTESLIPEVTGLLQALQREVGLEYQPPQPYISRDIDTGKVRPAKTVSNDTTSQEKTQETP